MVCRHPDVGRPFLEHSQDRAEHAVDGAKRMVGQLRAAKPVEMAKELVCAVDEVDDHAAISCSIRRGNPYLGRVSDTISPVDVSAAVITLLLIMDPVGN